MKTRSQSRSTVVDQVVSSTSPPSPLPMSDRNDDSQCEEDDDSDWSLENMPSMEPNEDSDSEYIRPIASAHKQRQGIATKKVLAHKRPATSVMKQSTCTSSASTTATNDTINALYQKALATSRTLKSLSHEKYNELLAEMMLLKDEDPTKEESLESNPDEAHLIVSPCTPEELKRRLRYHHPYLDANISSLLATNIPGMQKTTYGVDDMIQLEAVINGGIIAGTKQDDTVKALAELLDSGEGPNLVVVQQHAVRTWVFNLNVLYCKGHRIHVYREEALTPNVEARMEQRHIVITSYNTIEKHFQERNSTRCDTNEIHVQQRYSIIHKIKWNRVILIEASVLHANETAATKAVCALDAKARWLVTDTPLENNAILWESFVRFLRLEPINLYLCIDCSCNKGRWTTFDQGDCYECSHPIEHHYNWWKHNIVGDLIDVKQKDMLEKAIQNITL